MPEQRKRFIHKEFTISQESYGNGWNMPYAHYHDDYEVYILESGSRTISIGDCEYVTASHDAALLPPNVPHRSKGDSGFTGICIHFSQQYLNNHLTLQAKQLLLKCFASPVIHLSDTAFSIIKKYADNFIESTPDNFVILIVLLHLFNQQQSMENPSPAFPVAANCTKAQQILSYVKENYTSIKNIAELSAVFSVSECYVFKIFQREYHRTPKQYINELRIHNACHRLKNSDSTITAIAADCGFDCYEYFIRVFKQHKKCTPSEYRRSVQNRDPFSMPQAES